MTVSAEIQSPVGKGNIIPKHQSIGRNGSFWMPKDSLDIKKTSPLKSKDLNSNLSSSSKTSISNHVSKSAKVDSSTRPNLSFERTILSEANKISQKGMLMNKTLVNQNSKSHGQHLIKQNLSLPSSFAKTVKAAVLNTRPVVPLLSPKELNKSPVSNELTHKPTSRDRGAQDNGKKNKHHGAKNAQTISAMNLKENETSSQEVSVNNFSSLDTAVIAKFVNFIGKAVSPRVAYTNKFSKKVVRFALDLPDGGKLGVRLEKTEKGVSLCFIAPDQKTRMLLDYCQNGLKEKIDSDQGTHVNVHIFSDYQEMDNYFLKAA